MRIRILLLATLLFANGCGYDDFGEYDPAGSEPAAANANIADLKALYDGDGRTVYDDLVIAGHVTANDKSGNFYRTFIIEDQTGAIEVMAGTYDLHSLFVRGRYVAVRAHTLNLDSYNGVLRIGMRPVEGGFGTSYFEYYPVMARYVTPGDDYLRVEPLLQTIDALDPADCGRLVRIEGVRFVPSENDPAADTWAVAGSSAGGTAQTGYRVFADADDRRVWVQTSGYASFASERIPSGNLSLTGILMYGPAGSGADRWIIKIRDLDDVQTL